ncbi:hypothetical protein DYBT9275_05773 [Dyadobacter sp. CECT 9275]|uniref:Uncharacterized protein n=1 Tax=Dyadobacter helix TaxID=2822344 RepID=A0A916JIG5_9BACT|nr:hypothetical protein DYBT9275_05773 [Dyadobacter sp. CECT 9275]
MLNGYSGLAPEYRKTERPAFPLELQTPTVSLDSGLRNQVLSVFHFFREFYHILYLHFSQNVSL